MRFRFLVLALCLVVVLAVPAAAAEADSSAVSSSSEEPVDITTSKTDDGVTVNVTIAQPDSAASEAAPSESETADSSTSSQTYSVAALDEPTGEGDSGTTAASTMVSVVTGVLGEYQPKTYIVNEYASDGTLLGTSTQIVPGLAGLDYPWFAGFALFAIFIYGILRLIGGLLKL